MVVGTEKRLMVEQRNKGMAMLLAAASFAAVADTSNAAPNEAVPALQGMEFGWLADTEFLPPASGPGPVTYDRSHPYVRNNVQNDSIQATFRISDTTNP